VVIYRAPSDALYHFMVGPGGTKGAQDVIWAVAKPPVINFCTNDVTCIGAVYMLSKMHGWIYGDANDIRGAILDSHRENNCLALTLISRGAYIKNWTRKNAGCFQGTLSTAAATMTVDGELAATDGELEIVNGHATYSTEWAEPLPADEYLPIDYRQ
jgi:hypothetical protein